MKRWEFDSVEQASRCISKWFKGTHHEYCLLKEYLDSISVPGEIFYDAQAELQMAYAAGEGSIDSSGDNNKLNHGLGDCSTSSPRTPPPPSGPYKKRKIIRSRSVGNDLSSVSEEAHAEVVSSPVDSCTFTSSSGDDDNSAVVFEPKLYKDVLILFRFNDRDLPFKLKDIITTDLRLLTLLEAGLPSWVIFLQSYPVFCHLYRPWMCPLARALYVLISITTVLIGFYDLYKNVPLLKATAARLFGPLFNWIETWEMVSRIKYLGTMLFLHNFEKAVKWSLMFTRAMKSLFSVLTEPIAEPLVELLGFFRPFWEICIQTAASLGSAIWVIIGSACSVLSDMVEIVLWPMWFIASAFWKFIMIIVYPVICAVWEILVAPIRLVLASLSFVAWLCSYIFYLLRDGWLSISGLVQLASASESAAGVYEVSVWRSLWNDLFSQIFRATRSILYGFVAFFATCNRHRLSIYNHMQEFFLRLSCHVHNSHVDSFLTSRNHEAYTQKSPRKYRSSAKKSSQPSPENIVRRRKEINGDDE